MNEQVPAYCVVLANCELSQYAATEAPAPFPACTSSGRRRTLQSHPTPGRAAPMWRPYGTSDIAVTRNCQYVRQCGRDSLGGEAALPLTPGAATGSAPASTPIPWPHTARGTAHSAASCTANSSSSSDAERHVLNRLFLFLLLVAQVLQLPLFL